MFASQGVRLVGIRRIHPARSSSPSPGRRPAPRLRASRVRGGGRRILRQAGPAVTESRASSCGTAACSDGCPRRSAALPVPLIRQPHRSSTRLDVRALHGVEVVRPPRRTAARRSAERQRLVELQRVAGRGDHRALDDVLELADVAGPRVVLQRVHHRLRHLRDVPPEVALVAVDEEPHEPRDVLARVPAATAGESDRRSGGSTGRRGSVPSATAASRS